MIVVGGIGSAKGAIIGTALLLYIDRTYADLDNPAWRFVWIGIIMFGVTLLDDPRPDRRARADPRLSPAPTRAARDRRVTRPCLRPSELEVPGL